MNAQHGVSGMSATEKQALMRKVRARLAAEREHAVKPGPTASYPIIVADPANRHAPFPLTDVQASYFVGRQASQAAGRVGCHTYLEFEERELNIERLEQAWSVLVRRHDILRATVLKNGQQQVRPEPPDASIIVHDLVRTGASVAAHLTQVRERLSHKCYRPGDWPLYAIEVTKLDARSYLIHFSIDSWIVDAASAALVFSEWYQAYRDSDSLPAPAGLAFRDYVTAMKRFEAESKYQSDLRYWTAKLAAPLRDPALPFAVDVHAGADTWRRRRLTHTLSAASWAALKLRAKAFNVSSTTVLLTIFAETLAAWDASPPAPFALILTLANRLPLHPDIGRTVGPFTSTGVFIADHIGHANLAQRVQRYQRQLWSDLNHSNVSGVSALRHVPAGATPHRPPPIVFTSLVNTRIQRNGSKRSFADETAYSVSQTPGVVLDHQATEVDDALTFTWDVADAAFVPGAIDAIFADYCRALDVVAQDPTIWFSTAIPGLGPRAEARPEPSPAAPDAPFALSELQQAYLLRRVGVNKPQPIPSVVYQEFDIDRAWVDRLRSAWDRLIAAHDALRTVVMERGQQRVLPAARVYTIETRDLTDLDAAAAARVLEALRSRATTVAFSPDDWPPFEISVSLLDARRARVHLALDMLIADGSSVLLLQCELFQACADPAYVPSPGATHREHRLRVAADRASVGYAIALDYWTKKFAALPPGPKLPEPRVGGAPGQARRAGQFARWQELKELALRLGVAPGAVLVTAFNEVIANWSAESPFTTIVVDLGRHHVEADARSTVGDFSVLCWLTRTSATLSFAERVRLTHWALEKDRARARVSGIEGARRAAQTHECVRDLRFPVVFTDCTGYDIELSSGARPGDGISRTPDTSLDHFSFEVGGVLHYHWDYATAAVDGDDVRRCIAGYERLLHRLVDDAESWQSQDLRDVINAAPITDTPNAGIGSETPTDAERDRILYSWNDTDVPYDRNVRIHDLFAAQAVRAPERVALVTDDEQWSYSRLNAQANRLAHYLHGAGVGPERMVGVCLDRTPRMIVAVLAVLKAGGAYVPLDPADPVARRHANIQTGRIEWVLTQREHATVGAFGPAEVICLDEIYLGDEAALFEHAPDTDVTASNSAYVIFTSGSTGTPKGVRVAHRPVINLIEWAQREFGFDADDRALFVTPLGFDLSVFDIFGLLAYGGSLRLVSDAQRRDAKYLVEVLSREPITFWNSAPAALQLLTPYLRLLSTPILNDRLRLVFLSGDWIPLPLPDAVRAPFPRARVISLGGATEATVWSNYFPIGSIDPAWKSIPYGRPIQNAKYYILDAERRPCALGASGDLYIGGECLSEGYINSPELTAQRFLPNPFHGGLMYQTGDLARYLSDGNIEFLGRADDQVKIRGYRIELGEIETALHAIGYGASTVVARADTPGNKYLAAFVVPPREAAASDESAILDALRRALPEHMIPVRCLRLRAVPVTTNGKVDRKYLANTALDEIEVEYGMQYTDSASSSTAVPGPVDDGAPLRAATEQYLKRLVARILDDPEREVDETGNLGQLGFNSIHYTVLSADLQEEMGVEISPPLFFKYSRVTDIAGLLLEQHVEALRRHFGAAPVRVPVAATPARVAPSGATAIDVSDAGSEPIAIVGMSARMPQAADLEMFWANLLAGKDCIEEIPAERWDWRAYFGDSAQPGNKTLANRGGFMCDIDKFDAEFFGITPREAQLMDPRQRVLLESVWHAFEDAGYAGARIDGARIGVFVGATGDEFDRITAANGAEIDSFSLSGVSRTMLANRISYLLNLRGPSEVVDTACSSSLVAVHRAVAAIRSGECDGAIVAGINVMMDPTPHISLSKIGMLSPDGKCKAFDRSASGYVRGEGVGVVLLRRLRDAIAEGDPIHAVIRGSAINHGGRASSLTAPNPQAQAQVIVDAFNNGDIDPESVDYIEAHGTGTALGDPIEVNGLKDAFAALARARGRTASRVAHCGISAVKTNIGHLEAAAGIAGMLKVILALRHGQLPALLHLRETNPHIQLDASPFYLVREPQSWPTPVDAQGRCRPRRAGVSSFGFGGVNAHVVVEEYNVSSATESGVDGGRHVLVLSARSPQALSEYALTLAEFLRAHRTALDMMRVAYTLQTGRNPMRHRFACVVDGPGAAADALERFGHDTALVADAFRGDAKQDKRKRDTLASTEQAAVHVAQWIAEGRLEQLAQWWAWGGATDWTCLYRDPQRLSRMPLPKYPFVRERHWPEWMTRTPASMPVLTPPTHGVHPLLGEPSGEGRFRVSLDARAFFVADHVIDGRALLPGAAYIEMVRAAGTAYAQQPVHGMRGLVWPAPLSIDVAGATLDVTLTREAEVLKCRVTDAVHGTEHCGGQLVLARDTAAFETPRPIAEIRARCYARKTGAECYAVLRTLGIQYGPAFTVIDALQHNDSEALAEIVLPPALRAEAATYGVHPCLLDGALQTALLLTRLTVGGDQMYVPYAIDELVVVGDLIERAYVHVTRAANAPSAKSGIQKHDICITDTEGRVLLKLIGCTARRLATRRPAPSSPAHYYREVWAPLLSDGDSVDPAKTGPVVVWRNRTDATGDVADAQTTYVRSGAAFAAVGVDAYTIDPALASDYSRLIDLLWSKPTAPRTIVTWLEGPVGEESPEQAAQRELLRLFHMCQALFQRRIKQPVTLLVLYAADEADAVMSATAVAVAAFGKSVNAENRRVALKTVAMFGPAQSLAADIAHALRASALDAAETRVDRASGGILTRRLAEAAPAPVWVSPWRSRGVYLITGGTGVLAQHVARHLARQARARLVLAGRTPENEAIRACLATLRGDGGEAIYVQADVSQPDACRSLIAQARAQFGPINGVLHTAGVLQDTLLLNKTSVQFEAVLAPKLLGTVHLDAATRNEPLDYFVLFSSLVALVGNVGQSDYACANRFLDGYAEAREGLCARGLCRGRSVSINWPLWRDGGMGVAPQMLAWIEETTGMTPLTKDAGMQLLEEALASDGSRYIAATGDKAKLDIFLRSNSPALPDASHASVPAPVKNANDPHLGADMNTTEIKRDTEALLKQAIANETKLSVQKIDSDEPFEAYGIESVMIVAITRELEKRFGELSKTLFFEYQTISELADYFIENHADRVLAEVTQTPAPVATPPARAATVGAIVDATVSSLARPTGRTQAGSDDIAIIGVNGRFPMADDLREFWNNLKQGIDCITEVPPDRWDYLEFYDPERGKEGKSYTKWGGFMRDVDKFDPLFFNISNLEAEALDPQERLFLQSVYHAMEDAGYTRKSLADRRVGVYVGVMWGQYQLYGVELANAGSSYASIANRVSYFCNFTGPSIALDTMCSSSLTTIHLACESIKRGECDLAIAGGVNVNSHPNKDLFLSKTGFAASDGRCRSFGEGGDGYVPGDGVGTLLLKRLDLAEADGDHIYGVVKSSAINHGGKTNGYTVPNPKAQTRLIKEALDRSTIDPRSIGYIEAHGTGTALGDPIEITALTNAFSGSTDDKQFCAIGSVKSNVGHLESAAGVAGVIKVLLQMRHRQLVPSIHTQTLNSNINFAKTPFFVQRELAEWKQPVTSMGPAPRRAGVSSFGAGGANAHVILEEYLDMRQTPASALQGPFLLPISAKNEERLQEYARAFLEFLGAADSGERSAPAPAASDTAGIETHIVGALAEVLKVNAGLIERDDAFDDYALDTPRRAQLAQALSQRLGRAVSVEAFQAHDTPKQLATHLATEAPHPVITANAGDGPALLARLAYTLQIGREPMNERMALVASSVAEAMALLRAFLNGEREREGLFVGNTRQADDLGLDADTAQDVIGGLLRNKKLAKVAKLWRKGAPVDWSALYGEASPVRIPAPVYPFAKERCWVSDPTPISRELRHGLHPLLDAVDPLLSLGPQLVFRKALKANHTLTGAVTRRGEVEISHAVGLDAALAALMQVDEPAHYKATALHWRQPLRVPIGGATLYVEIARQQDGYRFQLHAGGTDPQVHASGVFERLVAGRNLSQRVSVEDIQARCRERQDGLRVYDELAHAGTEYSDAYRVLAWLARGETETIARYQTPAARERELGRHGFYPPVVEAVFQAIGLLHHGMVSAIDSITVHRPLATAGYVYVRRASGETFDAALLDEAGLLCLKLGGVRVQTAEVQADALQRFFYKPLWREHADAARGGVAPAHGRMLVVYPPEAVAVKQGVREIVSARECYEIVLGTQTQLASANCWHVDVREPDALDRCLAQIGEIDAVYFLGGLYAGDADLDDVDAFARYQARSLNTLYRLVRAIERRGAPQREMRFAVVTNNAYAVMADAPARPFGAGLIGLTKTIAREYPALKTKIVDLDADAAALQRLNPSLERSLRAALIEGNALRDYAVRDGKLYVDSLVPTQLPSLPQTVFKKRGVYVIVGGAGNVGTQLSTYLARTVNARIVWVGRRPLDDAITQKIASIQAHGGEVQYLQLDITDTAAAQRTLDDVERRFGGIQGVFHSAMDFQFARLRDLDEAGFERAIGAKVHGTFALQKALRRRNIDFLALFSSGESFAGNIGWGTYAAGCNFKDALGLHLAVREPYKVHVINWGFWGGDVRGDIEILKAKGIHPIAFDQGMESIERILGNDTRQVMALNVEDRVLGMMGVELAGRPTLEPAPVAATAVTNAPAPVAGVAVVPASTADVDRSPLIAVASVPADENAADQIGEYIKSVLARVLKIDREKFEKRADLANYGIDSLIVINIQKALEEDLGKLPATLLLENSTIEAVSEYLIAKYPGAAQKALSMAAGDVLAAAPTTEVVDIFADSQPVAAAARSAPPPAAARKSVQVVRVVEPTGITDFLENYGRMYKDGTLANKTRTTVREFSDIGEEFGASLAQVLVETPQKTNIEVITAGSGAPVLCMPAVALTAPVWYHQYAELSKKYQIITIHAPGYGLSDKTLESNTKGVSRVFMDVLDGLNITRPVHLLSSCFGGIAAQYIAKHYKDRVASLTLVGGFYDNIGIPDISPDSLTVEELFQLVQTVSGSIKADFEHIVQKLDPKSEVLSEKYKRFGQLLLTSQCANPLVAMKYLNEILTLTTLPWLADIEAPTLCVSGNHDTVVPPKNSAVILANVPNSRYFEVSGAGHYPFLTHEDVFNPYLENFIDEQEAVLRSGRIGQANMGAYISRAGAV